MTEVVVTFYWAVVAVVAYSLMFFAVFEALKPKPLPNPDWFWTGGAWVRSDEGVTISWVHSIDDFSKPEPTDPERSKPESGAG